ncbi:Asp23/Gls24 family envelope stress response protein [Jiangella ureilytica]|uniref:Asp23/Gls24 family envelope stress response protein n=1 Tax=Jiangella ureilytica TaxID=2530374 RepID=A0A4R4RLP0_9ACTN|nr:Asp23/Gls24 family envelope stress response protein [Jiangella ureilytica]TDC49413.1 Asp23/Gls24 family envelope stress response protein [Jiangella ureilytica]
MTTDGPNVSATGSGGATRSGGGTVSSREQGREPAQGAGREAGQGGPLVTEMGRTTIADNVVSKIAGIAAREVAGVHDLGGGTARMVGALRERIPGSRTNYQQGVSVEVGERQAAIDIDIVADYGVSVVDLSTGIRRNVIAAVERMTGLEVTEVNVTVNDVFVEGEDEDEQRESRVE